MHHLDLETLVLGAGAHHSRENGVCLMEAVTWWTGHEHSDHPACVNPVLAEFGRILNDSLIPSRRQELRWLIPQLPGTATDGKDDTRRYMALDWLIRTWTPAWLHLAGQAADARMLRELQPITSPQVVRAVAPAVRDAGTRAKAFNLAMEAVRPQMLRVDDAAWDAAKVTGYGSAWEVAMPVARPFADGGIYRWTEAVDATAWIAEPDWPWPMNQDARYEAMADMITARFASITEVLADSIIGLFKTMIHGEWPEAPVQVPVSGIPVLASA